MVRINKMAADSVTGHAGVAHLWLESTVQDASSPRSLCGEESNTGNFNLVKARHAEDELEAVPEGKVDSIGMLITWLSVEGLICTECAAEYRVKVAGASRHGGEP